MIPEIHLQQRQKRIWDHLDPMDVEDPGRARADEFYSRIGEYSPEYLFQWLSSRANFISSEWTKVWHYVNEKMPFDDRLEQVALSWIFFLGSEDYDLHQTKSVLFALFERWQAFGHKLPDLGEFLSDRLTSDASLLFELLRPKRLFSNMFRFLAQHGHSDDVLDLIHFCIEELPKEPYITRALFDALTTIIGETQKSEDNWKPHTRNCDFTQEHLNYAHQLQQLLEPIREV